MTERQLTTEELGQQIVGLVKRHGGGVSMVEVEQHLAMLDVAVKGDMCLYHPKFDHLVIWGGVSQDFVDALNAALASGEIIYQPTSPLIYMVDGAMPNLPVSRAKSAAGAKRYTTDHWEPMTLELKKAQKNP